jgi:hypothetical protein
MARPVRFTRERRDVFLRALASTGNVSAAVTVANIARQTAYERRSTDQTFAQGWAEAMEEATDVLEAEARRRAVEGVQEPLIVGGKLVERDGKVVMLTRYSDQLLIVLLRAHSQKFKTSQSAPPLMPWEMSDEQLAEAIEQCEARAQNRGSALGDRRHLRLVPKPDK